MRRLSRKKKLMAFTCLGIDMDDSGRQESTLLGSIAPLHRADRSSIKHLISMTFRTCLDEIPLCAHFTWTQSNYADRRPRSGHRHSRSSLVLCAYPYWTTLRYHGSISILSPLWGLDGNSMCALHCNSCRLLCYIHWQIYLFTDHRFICCIVASEHHPSNPAYTI